MFFSNEQKEILKQNNVSEELFSQMFNQLESYGFTNEHVILFIKNFGGKAGIEIMEKFLTTAQSNQGKLLLDSRSCPVSYMSLFSKHQITADDLASIANSIHGKKKLNYLCDLVQPFLDESGMLSTQLSILAQYGFTSKDVIDLLILKNGTAKLAFLCSLHKPMEQSDETLMDASGYSISKLSFLLAFKYSNQPVSEEVQNDLSSSEHSSMAPFFERNKRNTHVMNLLLYPYGEKHLQRLISLLQNGAISSYLIENPVVFTSMIALLSENNRTGQATAVFSVLCKEALRKYFKQSDSFIVFCEVIKKSALAAHKARSINTVQQLVDFLTENNKDRIQIPDEVLCHNPPEEPVVTTLNPDNGMTIIFTEEQQHFLGFLRISGAYLRPFYAQLMASGFSGSDIFSLLLINKGMDNLIALTELNAPIIHPVSGALADSTGCPLTYLRVLLNHQFSFAFLINIANHSNGVGSLNALKNLVQLVMIADNTCIVDQQGNFIFYLSILIWNGFLPDSITRILSCRNGEQNIAVLIRLVTQTDANQPLFSHSRHFAKLIGKGINQEIITSILVQEKGGQKLESLLQLSCGKREADGEYLLDEQGIYWTPYNELLKMGFTLQFLLQLTMQEDGDSKLRMLISLTYPKKNDSNQFITDMNNNYVTSLSILAKCGFHRAYISDLAMAQNGFFYLELLYYMLIPCKSSVAPNQAIFPTYLELLVGHGFFYEHFISLFSQHDVQIIGLLMRLCEPMSNRSGVFFVNAQNGFVSQLAFLKHHGFNSFIIVKMLTLENGANFLTDIVALLKDEETSAFIQSENGRADQIVRLAQMSHGASCLRILYAVLSNHEFLHYMEERSCFSLLCEQMRLKSDEMEGLAINSLDDLNRFLLTNRTEQRREPTVTTLIPQCLFAPPPDKTLVLEPITEEDLSTVTTLTPQCLFAPPPDKTLVLDPVTEEDLKQWGQVL